MSSKKGGLHKDTKPLLHHNHSQGRAATQNIPLDDLNQLFNVHLNDRDFRRLSDLIHAECGIKMPDHKHIMLETKLRKRLRALGMRSFTDYCKYLFSPEGGKTELIQMIDTVTTNKTDFFREADHFEFLTRTALPDLVIHSGRGIREKLMVWSAGCATGEEPYSLTMVFHEFTVFHQRFQFMVIATDISTRVLKKARMGIYPADRAAPIPDALKKKYLLRSKDENKGLIRIIPGLRKTIQFQRLNLMENSYGTHPEFDIIFCKNVMIYFDKTTQEKMLQNVCNHLRKGGYLFVGFSETLHNMDLPLTQVSMSVYKKTE
jgi:chemotaxis protein methyltransferase CheR